MIPQRRGEYNCEGDLHNELAAKLKDLLSYLEIATKQKTRLKKVLKKIVIAVAKANRLRNGLKQASGFTKSTKVVHQHNSSDKVVSTDGRNFFVSNNSDSEGSGESDGGFQRGQYARFCQIGTTILNSMKLTTNYIISVKNNIYSGALHDHLTSINNQCHSQKLIHDCEKQLSILAKTEDDAKTSLVKIIEYKLECQELHRGVSDVSASATTEVDVPSMDSVIMGIIWGSSGEYIHSASRFFGTKKCALVTAYNL